MLGVPPPFRALAWKPDAGRAASCPSRPIVKGRKTTQGARQYCDNVQDKCSLLEEQWEDVCCMLAGKGRRHRCWDTDALKRGAMK